MPNTATKDEVGKDLLEMSDRVSTIVRTTAIGVLAVSWGFIVTPNTRVHVWIGAVLAAIALAFIALLLDWAQYLVGYLNSAKTWDAMESDDQLRGWTPDWLYQCRRGLFAAKQVATFFGVVVLVCAMVPAIVRVAGQ